MAYRRSSHSPVRWPVLIALLVVGGLAGLSLAVYLSVPRLTAFRPAEGAQNASPRATIQITFDRPMDQASVESALRLEPALPGAFTWEGSTVRFTPRQSWPVESRVTVTLAGGRSQLGLPLLEERRWTFNVGRERLLFLYGLTPNLTTISITPDDTPQPLTDEPFGVNEFALSPDGGRIVYSARREDGGAALKMINMDGSGAQALAACPGASCRAPDFAPDGNRLAYERHSATLSATGQVSFSDPRVYVYTFETTNVIAGDLEPQTRAPHWTPDGRLSFYDADRQAVAVLNVASGEVTYIPTTSAERGAWSPDGALFVYPEISLPADAPAITDTAPAVNRAFYSHLLRVTVATNATENLSGSGIVEDAAPAYSPDGTRLAFARKGLTNATWTPGRQLWLMRADGADAHPLTNDPIYHHSAFAWNRDNQRLAFMRFNATDNAEAAEIWIINADGSGARRLVVGGYAPVWIP